MQVLEWLKFEPQLQDVLEQRAAELIRWFLGNKKKIK